MTHNQAQAGSSLSLQGGLPHTQHVSHTETDTLPIDLYRYEIGSSAGEITNQEHWE